MSRKRSFTNPDEGTDACKCLSRRQFLGAGIALAATPLVRASGFSDLIKRSPMVKIDIDNYHFIDPMFEGIRIILSYKGEKYSPAYIQGISGQAFRIAGPCPCAPTCSVAMEPKQLIKLLGYKQSEQEIGWGIDDSKMKSNTDLMIKKVKESIEAKQPVLVWHAFTNAEWDVVCGYDDTEGVFLGRGSYFGNKELTKAKQTRPAEAVSICPAYGALFIGEKVGAFDARAAELAALNETVRHAHNSANCLSGPEHEGLAAYDDWINAFKKPDKKRDNGDSYTYGVYRSTRSAASPFLKEIAVKYPRLKSNLLKAASEFEKEVAELDKAEKMIWWDSPELDPARNEKLWPILAKAREHYAKGISFIEKCLPK